MKVTVGINCKPYFCHHCNLLQLKILYLHLSTSSQLQIKIDGTTGFICGSNTEVRPWSDAALGKHPEQ